VKGSIILTNPACNNLNIGEKAFLTPNLPADGVCVTLPGISITASKPKIACILYFFE
jgi:hypothetical protein